MNEATLDMNFVGLGLYVRTHLWSPAHKSYKHTFLTFDTGASVTAMAPESLEILGYSPIKVNEQSLVTASGIEKTSIYLVERIKVGGIELFDVEFHSVNFPNEGFSTGVLGLNVLRAFDMQMLFSEKLIKLQKI